MGMVKTERVAVYVPVTTIGGDKNPLNANMTLAVQHLKINIQRGEPSAMEQAAMLIGIDAPLAAWGYGEVADQAYYKHLNVLFNESPSIVNAGEAWVIHGRPSVRNRFAVTSHVKMLLIRLETQRGGVPTIIP